MAYIKVKCVCIYFTVLCSVFFKFGIILIEELPYDKKREIFEHRHGA